VRTPRVALAALLAVSVVAAACGGGGDDGDDASTPTTAAGTTVAGETTLAPTTTAQEVGDCPIDALDSASGTVEVTFWHAMNTDNEVALQALVGKYNASQTKVKVNLVNQQGYTENFEKYRTASAADRPEIIQLPEYDLQVMTDSGTTVPVQACVNAESYDLSDFVERTTSYYTIQGALQAMPFNTSNPLLYFNKSMFTKAGLDATQPPTNLTELADVSRTIVDSGAAKYGIALDTGFDSGGGWFIEQFFGIGDELYADNGNGRQTRATSVLFDSEFAVQNYEALQAMVQEGTAFNVGENASGQAQLFKMADPTEPAAMAIYSSAGLGPVLNLLRGGGVANFTDDDLGIGTFPGPEGDGGVVVGGAALYIVTGKPAEKTAAAWDFIKFAVEPQSQSEWAAATGYVPVRKSSADLDPIKSLYATDPRFKVALDQLLTGAETLATAGPVLGPLRQVRQSTAKALQTTLDGGDAATALAAAAEESDALIADYNKRVGG